MWLFLLTVFQFSSGCGLTWPPSSSSPPLIVWWLPDNPGVNCFIRIIGPPASASLVIVNGYKTLSQPTFNKNWNIPRGKVSRPTSTNWNSLMVGADLNARPSRPQHFRRLKEFEVAECLNWCNVGARNVQPELVEEMWLLFHIASQTSKPSTWWQNEITGK